MKQLVMSLVAMLAMGVMAEIANTMRVTKFHQSYPYSDKATIEYTVGGTLPANVVAEIILNTDDASATFVQKNIVTGVNTNVIDFASSFGGVLLLTNASFVVTITSEGTVQLGGVQLWENGPYWAECNVGASKPEDYGYYFWWGDTVGYARSGGTWKDYGDGSGCYSGVTWVSSTGVQMGSSPFTDSSCPTMDKDNAELQAAGYIDSTGNLVAAHDAATAHLGAPWRMPTSAEIEARDYHVDNPERRVWPTSHGQGRLRKSEHLPSGCRLRPLLEPLVPPARTATTGPHTPDSVYSDYAWNLLIRVPSRIATSTGSAATPATTVSLCVLSEDLPNSARIARVFDLF